MSFSAELAESVGHRTVSTREFVGARGLPARSTLLAACLNRRKSVEQCVHDVLCCSGRLLAVGSDEQSYLLGY